jgi:hypothetical protein
MFSHGILVGPEGRRTVCPGLFWLFSKDKGTLPALGAFFNELQIFFEVVGDGRELHVEGTY